MKVFTFFYDRYTTATSSIVLEQNNIEHYVMMHSEEAHKKFVEGNTIKGIPIITNNPKGLSYQKNSALEMLEDEEWAVFMSDDFSVIKAFNFDRVRLDDKVEFDIKNQKQFRYDDRPTMEQLFNIFPYLIKQAERLGIKMIGFSSNENPRNVQRKFGFKGLVDGRLFLVKKSALRFDTNVNTIDDYYFTLLNIETNGNNLILNWISPEFQRYSSGGVGSKEARKEQRKQDCQYLVSRFPKLVKFADKAGYEWGEHIKIVAR